jgi:predicted amidophosphoribosyltransferase
MTVMAIDGAEITSDMPTARPKAFLAVGTLGAMLALAADLLLPPVCISCRKRAGAHGLLCGGCWAKIDFIAPPLCLRLGVPLPYDTGKPSLWAAAIADPLLRPRAGCTRYSSTMRDLVQSFKYGDRHEGVPLFGRWMTAAGAELLADADVIVPVPLYRSRLWSRRFIQSALLAQAALSSTEAEECRRDVSGHRPAGANSGQAHHRCRRRDHHRGHRRGLRAGAEAGRRGASRCSRAGASRGAFALVALIWNLPVATPTY